MTTRKLKAAAQEAPLGSGEQDVNKPGWGKLAISGLLLLHVTAVFWAPFAFASNVGPSSSPFADLVMGALRPYITAMYLDHGYFFFAPDPGPSHLVRYKLEFADGREAVEGVFPNLATEQPRLLYHRHFMMAEALHNAYVPSTPPPEPTLPSLNATATDKARYQRQRADYERSLRLWRLQRQRYEALWRSYEEHLKHEYKADKVTLTRIEHRLATPGQVRYEKSRLDDPASYVPLPENETRGETR
jgi:hypothetical protein